MDSKRRHAGSHLSLSEMPKQNNDTRPIRVRLTLMFNRESLECEKLMVRSMEQGPLADESRRAEAAEWRKKIAQREAMLDRV